MIVGLLVLPLAILILVGVALFAGLVLGIAGFVGALGIALVRWIVGILLILSLLVLILGGGIVGIRVVFPARSMAPILRHLLFVRGRELILNHARQGRLKDRVAGLIRSASANRLVATSASAATIYAERGME